MMEFFEALFQFPFLQNAALAGILAGVACGVVGAYVVVKRLVFISGGIAHTVLGGMGIAYYLGYNPMIGAVISAILAALLIGTASLLAKEREDTLIGALWAVGMAVGVLFISMTPGYSVDLMSYLFGNILLVSRGDLWLILALDGVIIALVLLLWKRFLAVSFDAEFAKIQGIPVNATYLLLLCLIALTVVTLVQVVGIILVIALLSLPAATAGLFSRNLAGMMGLAVILGGLLTFLGLGLSYSPDLPAGATIILLTAAAYLLAHGVKKLISGKSHRGQAPE
jgi:zinc transport system permease protein